jgi:hypothetical protein
MGFGLQARMEVAAFGVDITLASGVQGDLLFLKNHKSPGTRATCVKMFSIAFVFPTATHNSCTPALHFRLSCTTTLILTRFCLGT